MEVGSWGWTSGSDRPEWAPLGLCISPEQPWALPPAPGPSLFHRDCLMLCNEPHNTPRWPSGDFGVVPSPAVLPPLLSVCVIHQDGHHSSHQHHVIAPVVLVILKKIQIEIYTDDVDKHPCCLSCYCSWCSLLCLNCSSFLFGPFPCMKACQIK